MPVGSLEAGASPFRVLNLAGNVEEWTSSLEEGDTIVELQSNIAAAVVRGGHYLSPPENVSGPKRSSKHQGPMSRRALTGSARATCNAPTLMSRLGKDSIV